MAGKIDLDLLKRLVTELENDLNAAEEKRVAATDKKGYVIALSKCTGLAAGIAAEASALIGDMKQVMAQSYGPSKEDSLAKLLDVLGNPGGVPGSN